MSECTPSLIWPRAHKFEPRYDLIPPANIDSVKGSTSAVERFVESLTKRVYVCDVCARCGAVVKREVPA